MGNTSNENRWMSMAEICEHLGISRDTAIKWVTKKYACALKFVASGIQDSEVDKWVLSGGAEEQYDPMGSNEVNYE